MNKEYFVFFALATIFCSCGSDPSKEQSTKGHLRLLSLEIKNEGIWSEIKSYDETPHFSINEEGIATIIKRRAESCSFGVEDFNGFVRLTKDTVYVYADYNWVGSEPKLGTMDACIHKYIFSVANYPKGLPFKVVFD